MSAGDQGPNRGPTPGFASLTMPAAGPVQAWLGRLIGLLPAATVFVAAAMTLMGGSVAAVLGAATLVVVGVLLVRTKRIGSWLGLLVLAGSFVAHAGMGREVAEVVAAAMVLTILILDHDRYDVVTGGRALPLAIGLIAIGAGIAIASCVSAVIGGRISPETGLLSLASWAAGGSPRSAGGAASGATGLSAAFIAARVPLLTGALFALRAAAAPRASVTTAARHALAAHGRGGLLPYLKDPLVELRSDDDGSAVIASARAGRVVVALGDPAGAPDAASRLFDRWHADCRRGDLLPAIYQASPTWTSRLESSGWRSVTIGAEAILDPTMFDLASPRLANVRHTVTRARRAGLTTRWIERGGVERVADRADLASLADLDAAWRRRSGLQLGFTVGSLDVDRLAGPRTVAAIGTDGRALGCIVIRPTGADGGWLLDVMRRAPDSPPGAVELCVVEAIADLAVAGSRRLSLGLAPLARLDAASGRGAEPWLAVAAEAIRPLYDVRGLEFFKDKFAPTWEPRFLVVEHLWVLPGALIALVRLHLGGSWRAVMSSIQIRPS